MTKKEKIMNYLSDCTDPLGTVFKIRDIINGTELDEKVVKKILKELRKEGKIVLDTAFNDDGLLCGSGYGMKYKIMTKKEALVLLKLFNEWRRGAEIPQPHPADIGKAIDVAIKELEKGVKKK